VDDFSEEIGQSACYVYVLASGEQGALRTYVGWSTDPVRRLATHNSGKGARSTRGRAWQLIYVERCEDKRCAMRREWYLKRDRGFRKSLALHSAPADGQPLPG